MTALASLSDLVNRETGGNSGTPENTFWWKYTSIANVQDTWTAGLLYSMWRYDGYPSGASAPTTVAAPTNSTAGAMPFTNPGGGRDKWLISAAAMGSQGNVGFIMLYDRLLHIGSLDGTVTTAQTVGGSLTRYTGGEGNQIYVEIYTQVGTSARTITASYTNQAGTSGRTTTATAFGATGGTDRNEANQFIALPLQAGDTGVQAVASVTISATTGTAGNFGVVVAHPLAVIPLDNNGCGLKNFANGMPGLPDVKTNACIAAAMLAVTSTESPVFGALGLVEA